ncbi:MAG: site-specific integrase, partial [Fimbriimonadaceae bacterium]|nr:site-specific integrase [Fimbriimonadaceae bacterium]
NELVNLEWSDVDLKKGLINIRIKPFWKPKDGDARMFPIHSRVRAVLDSLPRTSRWVFTGVPCKKFPKGGQQVFDRRALSALKTALKRAGIAEGKVHTFRHFFITYCINKGVSPFMIAEWVGHSSLAMVMRYYRASAKESRRIMDGLADGDEEEAK